MRCVCESVPFSIRGLGEDDFALACEILFAAIVADIGAYGVLIIRFIAATLQCSHIHDPTRAQDIL